MKTSFFSRKGIALKIGITYFHILALFFLTALSGNAKIRYVKPIATGSGDGTSLTNASNDLQFMIDASQPNDEVWVLAGTYKPNTYQTGITGGTSVRDYTFTIKNKVKIYGGFIGTETDKSQRTKAIIVLNPSILSGDLGALNDTTDNSRHVLVSIYNDDTTVFDGFVVKDGTNDIGAGAGMYIYNSHIKILNCLFTKNTAFGGSGLEILYSEPTITNSTFHENVATRSGGGAASIVESFPKIINCSFSSNSGGKGGAIYNVSSTSIFENCTFSKNIATYDYDDHWVPRIGIGAAIFNMFSRLSEIKNCIFWGNTVLDQEVINNHDSILYGDLIVNFTDVQSGGYPSGIGNISIDPSFYNINDPDGVDNIFGTADDGLTLQLGSPAFNAGDNSGIIVSTDITGAARIQYATVDMGAYESSNAPIPIKLISFEGKSVEIGNHLKWTTSSEENFSHFEIQRTLDARQGSVNKIFQKIGEIKGKGNTSENQIYSFLDKEASWFPNAYYRLKSVDLNGKFEFSKIIFIQKESEKLSVGNVYPNPALGSDVFLNIYSADNEQFNIYIYDFKGKVISSEKLILKNGENKVKLNIGENHKGLLFIKIENMATSHFTKLFK